MALENLVYGQSTDFKLLTPPNCSVIKDNLFMDKTEITNIHWLEYLHYLKKDSSQTIYTKALPDTSVWLIFSNDSTKWKHYLRYPAYRTYPVVGISYEQANEYCRWRSNTVNFRLEDPKVRQRENFPVGYQFIFRLPTIEEWEFAAAGNLSIADHPYGFEDIYQKPSLNKNWKEYYYAMEQPSITENNFKAKFNSFLKTGKEPFFNCLKEVDSLLTYGALTPLSTKTKRENTNHGNPFSKPNKFDLLDMIGNVAEMTAQKGVAKGGSWAHRLNESSISSKLYYEEPTAWLGFRCICEVVKVEH
jgi:formylglycine-generating enzyme required for sulfatase activity